MKKSTGLANNKLQNELIKFIRTFSYKQKKNKPSQISDKLTKLTDIKAFIFDIYGTMFISSTGDISLVSDKSCSLNIDAILYNSGIDRDSLRNPEELPFLLKQRINTSHLTSNKKGFEFPEVDIIKIWKSIFNEIKTGMSHIDEEKIIKFSVLYEIMTNPVYPMPGLVSAIDYLKSNNIVMGIVSNAQFYTSLLFPAFFNKNIFELGFHKELCVWSYQEQRAKPDTKLFLKLLTQLDECYNIKARESVYIGNDMLNDIWTASQCGLKTILFAGDRRSLRLRNGNVLVSDITPDCIISELSQIREIV